MTAAKQSRVLTRPEPGYYLVRLVPKGWPVGARIVLADGRYSATVDDLPVPGSWTEEELEAEAAEWLSRGQLFDHPFLRVSLFGTPCTETDYQHRLALKAWAKQHRPTHPAANPEKPIDPRLLPADDF